MRNPLHAVITWLCLCLFAAPTLVYAATLLPIPEATGLLVDQVGALSEAEGEALAARLQRIQISERAQVAILVSGGTGGEPLADYALRVAESWKLGRAGRDDGLLIVVIPSATAARIEVGYGLEGVIPDARASRWLDDLLPAMKKKELASGLNRLLDQVEDVLPKAVAKPDAGTDELFPGHPEWNVPFVLTVFSLFALFPLFFGPWGSVASGPLLAAFLGGAAWSLWGPTPPTYAVAGVALVLPFLWSLNRVDEYDLNRGLRYARAFGNLVGVLMFFSVITLFVGAGLWAAERELVWGAPVFAGLLSIGLAVFLFPGSPAHYLMLVLRSAMHFVFILVVAYTALGAFMPQPGRIAFAAAAAVTAFAAIGLYLDSRERTRGSTGIRWSLWFFALAVLVTVPFGLVALVLAVAGDEIQLIQAAAGGGSIAGVLALAARVGLFAAVKVGLGGAFGGGGAGRSG